MATGLSIDPPRPCRARKAMSQPRLGAIAHRAEPTTKVPRPIRKTSLRPMRSAVDAENIRNVARTRVYASMIHDSPPTPAWKSRPIDGRARLTAVMSIPTSSTLTQQTASTTPRRAGLPGAGPGADGVGFEVGSRMEASLRPEVRPTNHEVRGTNKLVCTTYFCQVGSPLCAHSFLPNRPGRVHG